MADLDMTRSGQIPMVERSFWQRPTDWRRQVWEQGGREGSPAGSGGNRHDHSRGSGALVRDEAAVLERDSVVWAWLGTATAREGSPGLPGLSDVRLHDLCGRRWHPRDQGGKKPGGTLCSAWSLLSRRFRWDKEMKMPVRKCSIDLKLQIVQTTARHLIIILKDIGEGYVGDSVH